MEDQNEPQTWQEMLRRIIADPKAKDQVINATHIQPITLMRWIQYSSKPRDDKMRALLDVIPFASLPQFTRLIAADFPELVKENPRTQVAQPEPPLEFYTRMLSAHATTPPSLYPQALRDLLLQQMVKHFDPRRLGVAISIVRCTPPRPGQKVRSLQEIAGVGTSPWERDLGGRTIFLGVESLAGAAVISTHLVGAANREDGSLHPAHWVDFEKCAIAYPIMYKTRIAGSLLISGAQPYMFGDGHYKLIEHYAHLAGLAFETDTFYSSQDISLHMMPPYPEQLPLLRHFHQRTIQMVAEAPAKHQSITLGEAQELVWQDIEDELLKIALRKS